MKKIFLVAALFLLALFIFPTRRVAAREECNMLPGNIQCFRSWCDSGQVKVCESNRFCNCYQPGELIQEGVCSGQAADPNSPTSCVTLTAPSPTPSSIFEGCPENAINTAIGCIPIGSTNEFIAFILRWAIGIGGGIAFLLILYAGFMIMSSSGNPERLKAGQELMTSAIAGLIMLIFSVFILRVIGIDILKLPGFGQ
jgi:hypothetical protein